jgi:hypothetical protein
VRFRVNLHLASMSLLGYTLVQNNQCAGHMKFSHDTLTVQCIIPKLSKAIIDEIDAALAEHYVFTDEELDFIINYDIKYRMGQGEVDDE